MFQLEEVVSRGVDFEFRVARIPCAAGAKQSSRVTCGARGTVEGKKERAGENAGSGGIAAAASSKKR